MGIDYKKTLIIGLGFFILGISWNIFNSYIPIFLSDYGISYLLVGLILTIDNFAAITIQPYFGARSDKTWNKYGRRIPYLLVGIPLSAFFFMLIPLSLPTDVFKFTNIPVIASKDLVSFIFLTTC